MAALKAAFPYTLPIFAGFWFLGIAYGLLMNKSGFGFYWPMLMAMTIFMEQWMKESNHTASVLGVIISAVCLTIFGANNFVVPAMVVMLLCFMSLRSKLEIKTQ